jgi:hypothetical protein
MIEHIHVKIAKVSSRTDPAQAVSRGVPQLSWDDLTTSVRGQVKITMLNSSEKSLLHLTRQTRAAAQFERRSGESFSVESGLQKQATKAVAFLVAALYATSE